MGRAYIRQVDVSGDQVTVFGVLSQTGLRASLHPRIYIRPPEDGIWEYDLIVESVSPYGAQVLVPFSASAHAPTGGNGLRIIQSGLVEPQTLTLLTVVRVRGYTQKQQNMVTLRGADFEAASNQLVVDLTYGGGCFPHSFRVEWNGAYLKSNPPGILLNVVDTSESDPCKALLPQQIRVDLEPELVIDGPTILHIQTPTGSTLRIPVGGATWKDLAGGIDSGGPTPEEQAESGPND